MPNEVLASRAFGLAVKQARARVGLTQEALAQEARISVTSVGRIETGAHGVRLETILQLADALNIAGSELLLMTEQNIKRLRRRSA